MSFDIKNVKHDFSYLVLWAVGYQAIWYFAFQFIFHYQYIIEHASYIILAKRLGELLLYAIFSIRFALLSHEVSIITKFLLFSVAFSLWLLTLNAAVKTT